MERLFITVREAASITGLAEGTIQKYVQRGKYDIMPIPGKGRGGKQLLIALDSLPEEAQENYLNRGFTDPLELFTEDMMQKYTIEQRNEAIFRYNVLKEYYCSRMDMKAFANKNADRFGKHFSYRQLWSWKEKFAKQGIEGLIDQRGKGRIGFDCIPPEAWDMFYALYMQQQGRSAQICYDKTKLQFPDMTASYSTFTRRLREVPEYAKLRFRKGVTTFHIGEINNENDNVYPCRSD